MSEISFMGCMRFSQQLAMAEALWYFLSPGEGSSFTGWLLEESDSFCLQA